ncbi:unnamed protein product [Arabidopsis lyrata]|uniref:WPP domain-containing protein n=1 Tax=Arabidopsis lyrata subsp. lyrata TaxID=81972 RepID=D7M698_ARALL|nr:hypothetical protein ARALYDRAFT_326988 [Arabidopsis lyrata subsp. lyrata]CAH8272478.1 unnamed protein product [Arabidopsis lyrata]
MAEIADRINTTVSTPQPESESSKKADQTKKPALVTKEAKSGGILFSVWPPSQKSRDSILNSLIKVLSKDSFLSYKYGTIKPKNIKQRFPANSQNCVIESAEVRFKASGTKSTNKDDDLEGKTQP